MVTLQEHYEQTLAQRKKQHKNDVVAPALAQFQSIKHWPRSGQPLPVDVEHAVLRKQFTWTRLALPIFLRVLPVVLLPAAWGFLMLVDASTGFSVFVFVIVAFFCVVWLQKAAKAFPMHFLSHHVAALHLCYIDSHLPVSDTRQEAFSTILGHSLCKIYTDGDFKIYRIMKVRPALS